MYYIYGQSGQSLSTDSIYDYVFIFILMHLILNHVHYVTKINQAFTIFLSATLKKHPGEGGFLEGGEAWGREGSAQPRRLRIAQKALRHAVIEVWCALIRRNGEIR